MAKHHQGHTRPRRSKRLSQSQKTHAVNESGIGEAGDVRHEEEDEDCSDGAVAASKPTDKNACSASGSVPSGDRSSVMNQESFFESPSNERNGVILQLLSHEAHQSDASHADLDDGHGNANDDLNAVAHRFLHMIRVSTTHSYLM